MFCASDWIVCIDTRTRLYTRRLCHYISNFVYTDNASTKYCNIDSFIFRLVDDCSRSLCSRNIDPLNLSPWNWNSLHSKFTKDFIWQFIILLNKTKAGKTRFHTERYEFLFPDVVNDAERSSNQAAEKVSHNRKLKAKRLTDNTSDMCTKKITA